MRFFDAGARGDPASQTVHDRVLTVANGITLLRLLGLPVFVWLVLGPGAYGRAFAVLCLVAATDWVDGYVARRFDQVTRLGRFMDPLLDRILLATTVVTLVVAGFLPIGIAVAIVVRDAVVLLGGLWWFRGPAPIPVSRTGKFATACLLVGIPGFLLAGMQWPGAAVVAPLAWAATAAGLVAYYVGATQYARQARALGRPRPPVR